MQAAETMAAFSRWPPAEFETNTDKPIGRSAHTFGTAPAVYDRSRISVRLNVPTVSALRKRSVISTCRPILTLDSVLNMPEPGEILSPQTDSELTARRVAPTATYDFAAHDAKVTNTQIPQSTLSFGPLGSRRGSAEQRSASAGSSPTSTISTLDSALTGSSPSSSPESPISSLPMHSFNKMTQETIVTSPASTEHALVSPPPGSDGSEFSAKRPRNVRNLSINTRGITTRPATTASLVNPEKTQPTVTSGGPIGLTAQVMPESAVINSPPTLERAFSEPSSPSFIVPAGFKPRRRPSKLGLTISTPDSQSPANGALPETPGFAPLGLAARRSGGFAGAAVNKRFSALKSSERGMFSPAGGPAGGLTLPAYNRNAALPTPAFAPEGGMSLPPLGGASSQSPARPASGASPAAGPASRPSLNGNALPALSLSHHSSFEGGAGSSVIQHTVEHTPDFPPHDLPLSREVKSPSYPQGPACIYPPNVYLYHQPTAAEAREFDVVINVAREVPNPFEEAAEKLQEEQAAKGYQDASVQCNLLSAPPLVPFTSNKTEEDPATPRASKFKKELPEYIHLPWEHNSHVFEEWLRICELIDNRVRANKKVLIHCQLGVSRSASLIVAYGLYKNPSLSPDEAREAAKKQSKWIDLNMHFMYELGDFKKILLRKFPEIYTAGHAIAPQPLARTKTEGFLPLNSFQPGLYGGLYAAEGEGRRASSFETRTVQRQPLVTSEEDAPPGSAPLNKMWTMAEEDGENPPEVSVSSQSQSQKQPRIDAVLEHNPTYGLQEISADQSKSATPAEPAKDATRAVPTLLAPSPPLRATTVSNEESASAASSTSAENKELRQPSTLPPISASTPAPAPTLAQSPQPPQLLASMNNPAKDLPDLSTLRLSRQDHFTPADPITVPDKPLPTRTLRPMPSLPGGFTSFSSMRRPNLTLQTQPANNTAQPASSASGTPSTRLTPGTHSIAPPPRQDTTPSDAPFLPPLDLGSDSLMSPRTTAFVGNPFKRNSMAGDLAGVDWNEAGGLLSPSGKAPDGGFEAMLRRLQQQSSSSGQHQEEAQQGDDAGLFVDPRSPPTRTFGRANGGEVMRSIDDVL